MLKNERKEFTDRQKDKSIQEQSGLCYLCDKQLIGAIEFDHKISCETFLDEANDLNPADMNNDENCGACHESCHKHKSRVETGHRTKKKRQYKRYGEAAVEGVKAAPSPVKKSKWGKSQGFNYPDNYNKWTRKFEK